MAIAIGLLVVGFQELDRGGHRKVRRILRNCLIVWGVVFVIMMVSGVLLRAWALLDSAMDYFGYSSFVLVVLPLALALYLNRKQPKSTLQPTIDNAS